MQSATQTFFNAGPTDQRAASHGSKRPLVLTTKARSDITGQRSSLLLIPIPLALLTSHFSFCFTPLRHFPTRSCVINKSRLRCQTMKSCSSDTCYWTFTQSQHQDACYISCCTSSSFFILRAGGLPAERGEQGRIAVWKNQRAISPWPPLDTDFRLHSTAQNSPLHPPL